MEKNFLIRLTQEIYRLTLLFPKKEPLRYKIREVADDILANWLRNTNEYTNKKTENPSLKLLEDLEVLDGFFEVAKAQNWVPVVELLRIQEEYNRIKAEIKEGQTLQNFCKVRPCQELCKVRPRQGVRPQQISTLNREINARQQKILEFLKQNGRAQVWQIKEIFPEVTKRTLRRDFENLLKRGIIERIGQKNETFYQLKVGQDAG